MKRSVFRVPKMDCPSEEKLIRMALASEEKIALLQFDLAGRKLTAFHATDERQLLQKLIPLNFGAVHE